ncbi:hypothetical protein AUP68_15678 [Ilyonectria robusta]
MLPMKAISGHIATEWDADSKFKTVQKIVRRTEECELENVSEVSWNARVHELLLEIALEPFGKSISHWDVTKAPMNKLYLPRHGSGSDLQAKMVDFYICLGGNSTTAAIRHRLKKAGDCYSINHSPYQPLRYRPIAISIETKTPDGSGQEAKTQVSVWAAAYMARLRALSRDVQERYGSRGDAAAGDGARGGVVRFICEGPGRRDRPYRDAGAWDIAAAVPKPESDQKLSCRDLPREHGKSPGNRRNNLREHGKPPGNQPEAFPKTSERFPEDFPRTSWGLL